MTANSDDRKTVSEDTSDAVSQKCVKDVEDLKKNMTELYSAFVSLHVQLTQLNQQMSFHEKALKHIAVWSHHKTGHYNTGNDHNFLSDKNINSATENSLNEEQTTGLPSDLNTKTGRHHHIHHKNNDNSEESAEDSSEEQTTSTTLEPIVLSTVDTNHTLNDSKSKSLRKNHSIHSEHYMDPEFKEWFSNLLKNNNNTHNNRKPKSTTNHNHWNHKKVNQKGIDEMENDLNSEELIFATCNVKPNRHITLLNQQEVEGTINMWQLKQNRGPLHMHIKLRGFKVVNNEHKPQGNGHQRHKRESNSMPIEVEPNESNAPFGASYSHGFHVHESGNLSRDCQSVGNHYNPLNLVHGGPYDSLRHVGDLGNIRCDLNGEIDSEYTYSQVALSGQHSIINRSLVVSIL